MKLDAYNETTFTEPKQGERCGLHLEANNNVDSDAESEDEDDKKGHKRRIHFLRECLADVKPNQSRFLEINGSLAYRNSCNASGSESGISRSFSLAAALDVCETCNIRERFGRTRRHTSPESVRRSFTRAEWFAIFYLGMIDFIGFCSMSVMAPFFPKEAANKEMDVSHAGYVFSFYALVMFLVSPLFGKILPRVGAKFMFISGIFVTGVCNILFGILPLIRDNTTFAIFCFLVRGMEAVGAGAFSTASFIYVIHMFPDNISAVLGILETFAGLGMSIGPAFGGILYSVGGFMLPFLCLGGFMVAVLPLYMIALPQVYGERQAKNHGSFIKMIKKPSIFIVFFIVVVSSNAWSFLDPTLEPHLREEQHLESQQTGLVFLTFSGVYGVFSMFWGFVGDKCDNHWSMMAIGLIGSSASLALLGPSPVLSIDTTIWMDILSLSLLGISVSMTLAPSFKALLGGAMANGYQEGLNTYSIVAGIWSCAYSLGDMTGPTLGGLLLEYFDFPICTTSMAIIALTAAVICIFYFGIVNKYVKKWELHNMHPALLKKKSAYYESLSETSDAITITVTNAGAAEV